MKDNTKRIIQFASSAILLLIAYIPMLDWMIDRWFAKESYYGHGMLIPVVALYFVWSRKELLKKAKMSSSMSGVIIIAASLLIHIICAALKVYFISGFSFVFALYGLVLFFFGKEIAKCLIFPVFFLLAMIPLPLVLIGNLVVRLKLLAMDGSVFLLNRIGFQAIKDGGYIRMPNSFILVADPCSGLRSLISLLTLGLVFAFTMKASYIKKTTLLLSSVPIAIFSNVLRITSVSIVNDLYGEKAANGFFHGFAGFMVFVVAFGLLFWVGKGLENKHE
ncbi:MAG: exosortase/archaeosortase family protein [Candidatus Omnitrophota bacterium]